MVQDDLILEIAGYRLSARESDELLPAAEEQYYTRLTQWDVRSSEAVVGQARDNSSLTFSPAGGFYAQAPTIGETIACGM